MFDELGAGLDYVLATERLAVCGQMPCEHPRNAIEGFCCPFISLWSTQILAHHKIKDL